MRINGYEFGVYLAEGFYTAAAQNGLVGVTDEAPLPPPLVQFDVVFNNATDTMAYVFGMGQDKNYANGSYACVMQADGFTLVKYAELICERPYGQGRLKGIEINI